MIVLTTAAPKAAPEQILKDAGLEEAQTTLLKKGLSKATMSSVTSHTNNYNITCCPVHKKFLRIKQV